MKPTAFGNYLLLERIALGGMAEVFLAKSFGVGGFERLLAIKRILPQLAADGAFIGMFIDEARIAGQLSHANIASIYELGKVGDAHYIAMELVRGKDLLSVMNRFRALRKRMPPAMAAYLAARVAEALRYAHEKRDSEGRGLKLIHRDVSPPNILVAYDGAVKLIDFGVAKARRRTTTTQTGVLKGKVGYMSPEQVRGQPIDHRSDLFSVGVCLYELLTLERLFGSDGDVVTLDRVRAAKVAPPSSLVPDLPPALDAIAMRALARDPAERYQSAAALRDDLEAFLQTEEPRFTAASLAQLMGHAFSAERRAEDARLLDFSGLKRGDLGRLRPRPRSAEDSHGGFLDEPTHLFFSAEHHFASQQEQDWLADGLTKQREALKSLESLKLLRRLKRRRSSESLEQSEPGAPRFAAATALLERPVPLYAAASAGLAGFALAAGLSFAFPLASAPSATAAVSSVARPDNAPSADGAALATLVVESASPGLVHVDGAEYGLTPLILEGLAPGPHQVEVTAEGYAPIVRSLTLAPGQRLTLAFVPFTPR